MPCFIEMHVRCSHVTPELWGRRPNNHLLLVNVGEKFESEFDPLSVDITELVAMVFVNIVHVGVGPTSWSDVELAKACGACKEMMSKWLAAWSSMALSPNHQPRGSWGVGNLLLKDPAPLSGGEMQDMRTVRKGNACGVVISNWDDLQIGDCIRWLEQVVRKSKFISSESGAIGTEC